MQKRLSIALIGLGATTAVGAMPTDQAWPQWRGPNRDGTVAAGATWPETLDGLTKQWHVPLGPSYSGPVVCGDRVFVTETKNKKREIVRALHRESGKELWQATWDGAISVPFFAKANGDWIRSTPACDGESLYVCGIRDLLVSLDAASGKERWRIDFPEQMGTPVPSFGCVSSPLVVGDFVYVQAGGGFVKVDKRDGRVVWKILDDGGGMSSAFSSPIMAEVGGVRQMLVQMRQELVGIDPDRGELLWRQTVPSFRGMNILTPLVYGNGIFTSTHRNKSFFYRVNNDAGRLFVEEAWTTSGKGYMSSPVLIDDHAYLHLGNGRLTCVDLREGKETWRSKPFGKYWSMAVQDGRILALDERGDLLLIDANPAEFRLLDRKTVSDGESWAHIAVVGKQVFVRDLEGIAALSWN